MSVRIANPAYKTTGRNVRSSFLHSPTKRKVTQNTKKCYPCVRTCAVYTGSQPYARFTFLTFWSFTLPGELRNKRCRSGRENAGFVREEIGVEKPNSREFSRQMESRIRRQNLRSGSEENLKIFKIIESKISAVFKLSLITGVCKHHELAAGKFQDGVLFVIGT